MKRVLAQVKKEISQFLRDRLTVALAFVLPLLTYVIFGYAVRLEEKDIPITVQDFDKSTLSRGLADRLFSNAQMRSADVHPGEIVHNAVDTGRAQAVVIIPPDFSRRFEAKLVAPIEVLIDGTDVNNARVIKNSVLATVQSYQDSLKFESRNTPIHASIRIWFNPGRLESLYVVPGVIGLCLWIYPSLLAALAIVREKEQGTILQAYASSITSVELLAGKALAYLLIGLAIAVMLISLGCILFDLRFAGDPTPYLVSTVIFVLDSVVFGLMIGSGVTTQAAAVQGVAFAGFTTALLLSGFLYPLRNIQFPFNYVSYMVPARYYMMLSRDAFVRGSGWAGLWYVPLLLLLFFFLYFRVCNKRFSSMQIDA
jgi:ABC-2 type transport system permease protein